MNKKDYFKVYEEKDKSKIIKAKDFFKNDIVFVKSVVDLKQLPVSKLNEICFAGRSNCGKSTLLNTITNKKKLARVSNTPGRTQELNFFLIKEKIYIVDLPGYGYAKAPLEKVFSWQKKIKNYLCKRSNLRRVFLLIDARRGITEKDINFMEILDNSAVSFQLIITKTDKCSANEIEKNIKQVICDLKKFTTAHPEIILTSSSKKIGVNSLRSAIANLI